VKLSGLWVWKNTVSLGYPCLESFLSSWEITDEQILCVDPTSDNETIELSKALGERFPTVRVVWFKWPEKTPDGGAIGIATNFAKAQATGTHIINIQADEVYSPPLLEWCKTDMRRLLSSGGECIRFKILHTEFNVQQFQGGERWDGRKDTDVWSRGGLFNGSVGGAGYNVSVKVARNCPAIRSAHDGWQWDGCSLLHHASVSDQWPIVHLHDMMRDHYIDLRKNAGYNLWTDQEKYGFYKADADRIESTRNEWYDRDIWTRDTSPFEHLLPSYVNDIIGTTSYKIRWELIR
jgi:hypothetical protein